MRTDFEPDQYGGRLINRGISSDDNTKCHCSAETENNIWSKEDQYDQRQRNRYAGHHRSRQGFVDGQVQKRCHFHFAEFHQILANTVIHNNRIVQRIADNRQQSRDDVEVKLPPCKREQSEGQRHVVHQRPNRPNPELPFKPEPDIDRNTRHRRKQCKDALAEQFLRNLTGHRVNAVNPYIGMIGLELFRDFFRHCVSNLGILIRAVGQLHAD